MKIWRKIFNKNYWISVLIIVLCVMLFKGFIGSGITRYIGLKPGIILDFFALLIIIFLSRLISEEILEVNI